MIDYESKFRQAIMDIGKYGEKYAETKGVSWQLQELKKVILSEQMKLQDQNLSVSERESRARYSDAYKNHLEACKEAIQIELTNKVFYEKSQATFEALRSLLSLEKKKIDQIDYDQN